MHSQKYYEKKLREIQSLKQKPTLKPEDIEKIKKEDNFKNRIFILGTNPLQDILPLQIKPTLTFQSKDDIENYKKLYKNLPNELRVMILKYLIDQYYIGNRGRYRIYTLCGNGRRNRLSDLSLKYPPNVIRNKLLNLPITPLTLEKLNACKKFYNFCKVPFNNRVIRKDRKYKYDDEFRIMNIIIDIDYIMKNYAKNNYLLLEEKEKEKEKKPESEYNDTWQRISKGYLFKQKRTQEQRYDDDCKIFGGFWTHNELKMLKLFIYILSL